MAMGNLNKSKETTQTANQTVSQQKVLDIWFSFIEVFVHLWNLKFIFEKFWLKMLSSQKLD